jgi:ribosome-associated heat shock protein Hsp15
MRVDLLLSKLCLVKSRSIVKKACDLGLVKVNGKTAKASTIITENDTVEYQLYSYITELKMISIPKGNVAKTKAPEFYELIRREKIENE